MLILDRFEESIAVIENGDERIETSRENISADAAEGDVLVEKDGRYFPDKAKTEKRRKKITELQNGLWG